MRYMLPIYNNPATHEAFSQEERDELFGEVDRIINERTESGEWVGGEGLADASTAKTVRFRGDVPAVTDGPFVEGKERLAGYCIVDCETIDRAVEIAADWPDAKHFAMEVRALMSGSEPAM